MKNFSLVLVSLFCSAAFGLSVESFSVLTPRGKTVAGFIHYADKSPSAAVVLAPGRGYNMELPLTKDLAEKLAASGISAVRFDWAYYSEGGKPSPELVNELEDYKSVVEFLKTNRKIDSTQLVVAGKSLGTVVASRYFEKNQTATALFLLTPICANWYDDQGNELENPTNGAKKNYPQLLKETRDVVILLGDQDPNNCPLPFLYDFLKESTGNIKALVVGGNHSLELGDRDDEKFQKPNRQNMEAAQNMIIHWAHLILDKLKNQQVLTQH
jgi:alpha/beta superfamily hydrolase